MSSSLLRALFARSMRTRVFLNAVQPIRGPRRWSHHEGPPQPFDNMPFSIPNRFAATAFFSLFFGIGLWAPMIIVWYSMAKRTL